MFASIAAIGFASISNPPRKAYRYCALIAAVGHSIRFLLMLSGGVEMHIVAATALASFVTGMVAVLFPRVPRCLPKPSFSPRCCL